ARVNGGEGYFVRVLAVAWLYQDEAAGVEHPGHRAGLSERPARLGDDGAYLGDGAVAVIGDGLDEHGYAVRAVCLVHDLLVMGATLGPARAPLDGALDVFEGHVLGARPLHGQPQAEVRLGVTPAFPGRDGYFTGELGEELASPGVGSAFLSLDCSPFAVSGH